MLFVDAGDFTGDPGRPGELQTEALIDGMNRLGYAVANLSQRELMHGYETFLARQKKATFTFVSANIVWQDSGEPLVAPSLVRTVRLREGARSAETRIGFVGLTRNNPAFLKDGPNGRRIVTVDPLAAAEKAVAALKGKADVIVALAALDLDEARQLAKRVKEFDLILGGDGPMATRNDDFPEDTLLGRSHLFFLGDQGKNLGEVRLFVDAKGGLASTQRAAIGLSREWPEDAGLKKIQEDTKVAVNDINKDLAQQGAARPAAMPALPLATPVPPQATYTASARCQPCHAQAYAVWLKSGHSRAFATLQNAHQDFNPKCVGCHTIGYGRPNGFQSAATTPTLVNVGCESCHGPSGGHPAARGKGYGHVDTTFCVTCHTKENSPDFVPATYIPKIRHWSDAAGR